jgi:hypothetical protein
MTKLVRGVRGGTVTSGHLCASCEDGQVVRGLRESQELTWCLRYAERAVIPWPVGDCNVYRKRGGTSLRDFEQVATVITLSKTGKVGFLDPKKFREAKEAGDLSDTPSLPLPGLED